MSRVLNQAFWLRDNHSIHAGLPWVLVLGKEESGLCAEEHCGPEVITEKIMKQWPMFEEGSGSTAVLGTGTSLLIPSWVYVEHPGHSGGLAAQNMLCGAQQLDTHPLYISRHTM